MHVVWFKRDLRVGDHRPLAEAAAAARRSGHPVVCLYAHEPELLESPEWDPSHTVFIDQCLRDLDRSLRERGTRLTVRVGGFPGVLEDLYRIRPVERLWSHEETGNALTYDRDRRVAAWCRARGVPWTEHPNHGVFRPLRSRYGWAARWAKRMNEPCAAAPAEVPCVSGAAAGWDFGPRTGAARDAPADLGLPASTKRDAQSGGEAAALETLAGFFAERGVNYRADMASPITGAAGCSRLSPYLAWGALSVRTVHRALKARQAELRATPAATRDPRWLQSMTSFQGRLRWHCHFIQKLEDEPAIEHRNMHRAYDGLRTEDPDDWSEEERLRFEAWRLGRTGYPFVDACMRCLHAGGWMNFRMRSMLVSFASYHLWLHWRSTAVDLARHFLDFEPGIHFSQFQMQSGTTGINTVRIYNPIKQGLDQDPRGEFVRRWVPELAGVPDEHIHEPWKEWGGPWGGGSPGPGTLFAPDDDVAAKSGRPYPPPIVEHKAVYRLAQQRIFAVRKTAAARAEAKRVYDKHGSRRRPTDPPYRGGPEDRGQGRADDG